VGGHIDFTRLPRTTTGQDPFAMLKPLLEDAHQSIIGRGGAGLLLTVDELHAANVPELERLGNDLQHVQNVVFAGAALPSIDEQIFSAKGATFFSRLARHNLEPLSLSESLQALLPPFDDAGISYDTTAMQAVADETNGYPYLVQLLGYEIWQRLDEDMPISPELLADAFDAARDQSIFDVLAPTWRQLSPTARKVLGVIAERSPEPAKASEIYQQLDKTSSWFSVYRSRLIKAGMLSPAGRGYVALTGGQRAAEWILEQLAAADIS